MISKNIYAETFFQINCLYFLSFGRNKSVFKNQDFTPNSQLCRNAILFLEIRSKVKNHHVSEAGVSFENIVWSVYQDMGWRTHFYIWHQTIALMYIAGAFVPFVRIRYVRPVWISDR